MIETSNPNACLTKLRVLDYEYTCDRIAKFQRKIFITRVLIIQILTTKYFSFQYSVTYCSQALRRPVQPTGHVTVHLLTHETPDFITPALWPANSPDLNPVDYRFREAAVACVTQPRDVDQLKSRLIEEWEHFHQVVIDEAVRQWRPCLRACVRAHGGHFEH